MVEQGMFYEESECDTPEAVPSVPVYSPKESARLVAFHNISTQVHEERAHLNRGLEPKHFGEMNKNGEVLNSFMRLDGKFLDVWSNVLENMYNGEFSADPKMQDAAKKIIDQDRLRVDGMGQVLTPGQCEDLFNRE